MISLAFAVVLAAAAADPAAQKAEPAKVEKADKDRMVCKKEPVLGSRMKQRICMTQDQWDQRKNDARDDLDAAQRNRPLNSN